MSLRLSNWQLSILIHSTLLVTGFILVILPKNSTQYIDVPIYVGEDPLNAQALKPSTVAPIVLKSVNAPSESKAPPRAVFGTSRNSLTSDSGVIAGKQGNTLSKAVDNTTLNQDDADALPVPTDEFLVSQMPQVLSEVKPLYPEEAREARQVGAVVVDALIDAVGNVRQVSVVEGAEVFRASAIDAIKKFRFKPALIDGKAVAVRIRYTLRFKLEL